MSAVCCLRSLRRSNTISKAIQNSRRPPEMRKAGMPTPRSRSSTSPPSPKNARMQKAISDARMATRRRSASVIPRVSEMKIGARADRVEDDQQGDERGRKIVEEHRLDLPCKPCVMAGLGRSFGEGAEQRCSRFWIAISRPGIADKANEDICGAAATGPGSSIPRSFPAPKPVMHPTAMPRGSPGSRTSACRASRRQAKDGVGSRQARHGGGAHGLHVGRAARARTTFRRHGRSGR